MIIEISVSLIAFTLVISVVGLFAFFFKMGKTFESVKKEVHVLSSEVKELVHKLNGLITDLQKKSDSLDVVFRPLKSIRKAKVGKDSSETFLEIAEWLSTSFALFHKLKNAVKSREK